MSWGRFSLTYCFLFCIFDPTQSGSYQLDAAMEDGMMRKLKALVSWGCDDPGKRVRVGSEEIPGKRHRGPPRSVIGNPTGTVSRRAGSRSRRRALRSSRSPNW